MYMYMYMYTVHVHVCIVNKFDGWDHDVAFFTTTIFQFYLDMI